MTSGTTKKRSPWLAPEASPTTVPQFDPRSDQRRRQVRHLVRCGERCVLEALLAVDAGQSLDFVLGDFERLHPGAYKITSKFIRGTT